MNDEIIATLLEWNPWFENSIPETLVGYQRDYDIVSYMAIPEIKILEGVRRSGKSTLLYQVAYHALGEGNKVLYINFDDEILKSYTLSEIYYAFQQYSKIDYLLIDEIQQCHDWVPTIRKYYDRKELKQIWITGSNSSMISKEYAELLTGRNLKLNITPLSFSEFLRFKKITKFKPPISKQRESQVKRMFSEYLNMGAFPAISLREVYQRELLNNYFEDFIYKDIAKRYDVNISKLKDLVIYLATNSTKLISYRKIAKFLGLHPNTVSDYISHMKEVFLFSEVYKYDYSLQKQYAGEKKLFIIDTGLANSISFRFSEDKGRMLETLVYRHLIRLGYDVYFHKDKKECDFIIKRDLDIVQAIQVCCSIKDPKTKEREIAGLTDAMQAYNLKYGLLLTFDETDNVKLDVSDDNAEIAIRPVWHWMLDA